ncbi:MAG: cytochrome c-type biogenesis protein [Hyphomicrobium sp.]
MSRHRAPRQLIAILFLALMSAGLIAGAGHAVQPDEVLSDSALEARARSISHGLRCLVCQNQSIDDSDAPLARDLRLLVRERLVEGDSDDQVRAFLVARFGDFVLLKPPFKGSTVLLWIMPLLLLAGGVAFVARYVKSPGKLGAPAALTPEEERALKDLIGPEGSNTPQT